MKKSAFLSPLLLSLLLLLTTACNTARLSTAIEQYKRGEYFEASQTLKTVYRKTDARSEREKKGEAAWYMGLCFEKLMIPAQAASGFQNAQRYGWDDDCVVANEEAENIYYFDNSLRKRLLKTKITNL